MSARTWDLAVCNLERDEYDAKSRGQSLAAKTVKRGAVTNPSHRTNNAVGDSLACGRPGNHAAKCVQQLLEVSQSIVGGDECDLLHVNITKKYAAQC